MALTRVGCHVRRAGMAMAMGMPFCMRRASRQRIIHIAHAITSVTRAYVTRSTKIETCAIWQLAHGLVLSAVVRAVRRLRVDHTHSGATGASSGQPHCVAWHGMQTMLASCASVVPIVSAACCTPALPIILWASSYAWRGGRAGAACARWHTFPTCRLGPSAASPPSSP